MRRTQLKKMSMDEIMLHLSTETDPETIKLITSFIADKNTLLIERRNALLADISEVRTKLQKSIKNLNGRVKDRLQKKETVIMDKDSRPTPETITEIMDLFAYLEDQGRIISRNNRSIREAAEETAKLAESLKEKVECRLQYDELDAKLEVLSIFQKTQRLNARRRKPFEIPYYGREIRNTHAMQTSMPQSKATEETTRQQSNNYIQKNDSSSNFQVTIKRELDKTKLQYNSILFQLQQLPATSLQYQWQLLKAQEELNACSAQLQERRMMQFEGSGTQ